MRTDVFFFPPVVPTHKPGLAERWLHEGCSQAVGRCLIGLMTAAAPPRSLQIGPELISLARLVLKITEGVGGEQAQIGTYASQFLLKVDLHSSLN